MNVYAAFLDFETTGFEPGIDRPVEFAAIVYDTKARNYVASFEDFLSNPDGERELKVMREVSRIEPEYIALKGVDQGGFRQFHKLCMEGRILWVVAHNAEFDRAFFELACGSLGLQVPVITWIDSIRDYPWPDNIKSRQLSYLCADHGFLNPFAHRAISDCLSLYGITRQYEWDSIIAYSQAPIIKLKALVEYSNNHLAKAAGFRWNPDNRHWWIELRGVSLEDAKDRYPFPVREIRQ